jgi:hypothetical protein
MNQSKSASPKDWQSEQRRYLGDALGTTCICLRANIPQQIYDKTQVSCIRKRTMPTERQLFSAKLMPTSADKGCHVVSVTYPYGRILGFVDLSRYYFFQ